MFVLANFVQAVAVLLGYLLKAYNIIVMVSVLVSWVSPDPFHPLIRFLRAMTEPVFDWIRRQVPFVMVGMMDLSPIVVFLGIWFLQMFLVGSLLDVAVRLR